MGFEVDSEKLAAIARQLRSGADSLDEVAKAMPEAVDAGFSSDVANAALARVGKTALALARQGEVMASNIDAAQGAYLATDEDAEDQVEMAEKDLQDRQAQQQGPLKQAPPEPASEQLKNQPAPVTPTAPAPTPPPAPN